METFDNVPIPSGTSYNYPNGASGAYAIGSYQMQSASGSPAFAQYANRYGGAGNSGKFLAVRGNGVVAIDLTASRPEGHGYVGLWWSAGNAGNLVTV